MYPYMHIEQAREVLGPIRVHYSNKRYLLDQKSTNIHKVICAARDRLTQIRSRKAMLVGLRESDFSPKDRLV